MQKDNKKKIILIASSIMFLIGFVMNIIMNTAPFNYNLQVVPDLQQNAFLGSSGFLILMNIFSNLLNPIVCAGYILLFYLFSNRKLEVLIFLMWFIILSVLLSFLKEIIHQARPYWMKGSGVKMLEWTCYTEYGCPSGHSMLGLVLIQFIVRFFQRGYGKKYRVIGYTLGLIVQACVCFSRIILGMHSLNQVLFGLMMGFYSFIPYYLYLEKYLLKLTLLLVRDYYKKSLCLIFAILIIMFLCLEIVLCFILEYDYQSYWQKIRTFHACQNVKEVGSFQYKCFQDQGLIFAVFGIFYGIITLKEPENLMKIYSGTLKRKVAEKVVNLVSGVIPVVIFLNPWWKNIQMGVQSQAFLIWGLNSVGLFLGIFFLVAVGTRINSSLGLSTFSHDTSIKDPPLYQSTEIRLNSFKDPHPMDDSIKVSENVLPQA